MLALFLSMYMCFSIMCVRIMNVMSEFVFVEILW